MKRITLVALVAFFSAVATTGCFAQSDGGEESEESYQTSRRAGATGEDDAERAELIGAPAHALELKSHTNDDSQGPHPEPWLDQQGPHPEPWTGKIAEPDPNASGSSPKP